jgi:hypothetical protein
MVYLATGRSRRPGIGAESGWKTCLLQIWGIHCDKIALHCKKLHGRIALGSFLRFWHQDQLQTLQRHRLPVLVVRHKNRSVLTRAMPVANAVRTFSVNIWAPMAAKYLSATMKRPNTERESGGGRPWPCADYRTNIPVSTGRISQTTPRRAVRTTSVC